MRGVGLDCGLWWSERGGLRVVDGVDAARRKGRAKEEEEVKKERGLLSAGKEKEQKYQGRNKKK
jgi:hypothetical protein